MATKIKMLSDWKNRKADEVWSAPDGTAKNLIDAKMAVVFSESTPVTPESNQPVSESIQSIPDPVLVIPEPDGDAAAEVSAESSDSEAVNETASTVDSAETEARAANKPIPHRRNRRGHTK